MLPTLCVLSTIGEYMDKMTVFIAARGHANFDSLPLRFGIHFDRDQRVELYDIEKLGDDPQYSDRFHVMAKFKHPLNKSMGEHSGHFVLGQRSGDMYPALITVWRNDRDAEWRLSETVRKLREDNFITVDDLLKMHPLYVEGKVNTSASLIQYLSKSRASEDIKLMQGVVDQANAIADKAIKELEQAREAAEIERNEKERIKAIAMEATFALDESEEQKSKLIDEKVELETQNQSITQENAELKARLEASDARYKVESSAAARKGDVATLSGLNVLKDVLENQLVSGSYCTVLVFADGTKKYMKTTQFDRDGRVTAIAKSLKGRRVRTTCWDPKDKPLYWTNKGYFRNVYEMR